MGTLRFGVFANLPILPLLSTDYLGCGIHPALVLS